MAGKFLVSCTAFSLVLGSHMGAQAAIEEREIVGHLVEEFSKVRAEKDARVAKNAEAQASTDSKPAPQAPSKKKTKAHFVGAKRPPQNSTTDTVAEKPKKSTKIRNEWVVSKTYPKARTEKKETEEAQIEQAAYIEETKAPFQPFGFSTDVESANPKEKERMRSMEKKISTLQMQVEDLQKKEGTSPDHSILKAPKGHVFFTGEWLFWSTMQGGSEFAVERVNASTAFLNDAEPKRVNFNWQSGFRVGFGVHLPSDKWDIYINYTDFKPEKSRTASGNLFPLLAYQGADLLTSVEAAHAHWKIHLQTADVQIGRAYSLIKTLLFRPYVGMKGVWIDQHMRCTYTGGEIAANREFQIRNKNDFKGVGALAGLDSNLEFGAGFSFFGNVAASLLAGHFNVHQLQTIPTGVEVIDIHSHFNRVNPMAQMLLGFAWDHNYNRDMCHFGISASFESQYFWNQNQMERFTDNLQPIYTRSQDDLGFYGLTLMARIDF